MNLIEIAKQAGVSKSTISRVLNNHANVAPATAERVKRIVAELNYSPSLERRRGRPSKAASGLRTGTIAFLVPDQEPAAMRTPLSAALAQGLEQALYQHNLSLVVAHLRAHDQLPPCFGRRQIDGAIVRSGVLPATLMKQLRKHPIVWLLQHLDPLPFDQVLPDNLMIGAMAFQYLSRHGCQRVMAINVSVQHPSLTRRCEGFIGAAHQATTSATVAVTDNVMRLIADLVTTSQLPDGIFVPGTDPVIEEVYQALKTHGIEPVTAVKLIACNTDLERLRTLDPRIPNIDIQPEEISRVAVDQLLWRLQNPERPTKVTLIPPRLLE